MEDKITLTGTHKDCEHHKGATKKKGKKIIENKHFEGGKNIDLTKKPKKQMPQDKNPNAKKGDNRKQESITKIKKKY